MIQEYFNEIAKFIKKYYPKAICYQDLIEQNFKLDSFLIECLDIEIKEKIHNIEDVYFTFSITYFSEMQSHILDVLMLLDLELHAIHDCKIMEKEIVDIRNDKGTILFSFHQRLKRIEDENIINQLKINSILKGE